MIDTAALARRVAAAKKAARTRRLVAAATGRTPRCSRCRGPRSGDYRYCRACHAAYMRTWRKSHPITPEQRPKVSARAYARTYRRRGKLIPVPCQRCGAPEVEMHHPDYSRPLDVTWLCRPCHLAEHSATPRKTSLPPLQIFAEAAE